MANKKYGLLHSAQRGTPAAVQCDEMNKDSQTVRQYRQES